MAALHPHLRRPRDRVCLFNYSTSSDTALGTPTHLWPCHFPPLFSLQAGVTAYGLFNSGKLFHQLYLHDVRTRPGFEASAAAARVRCLRVELREGRAL